jgi:hypothetical protein
MDASNNCVVLAMLSAPNLKKKTQKYVNEK